MSERTIAWFSCGASSAVAVKLASRDIDEIIYTHIDDQHPDSKRFLADCERWFGRKVEVIQSQHKTVENACRAAGGRGYINGPGGAACTRILKRRVRQEWEREHDEHNITYIWGLDKDEQKRADRIIDGMPKFTHRFPLIENGVSKSDAHKILRAEGIKRPEMYALGYHNNNCVGCVKGGKGYWNKIRTDFPDVFEARAKMERLIRATCIKGVYLDELDPDSGRKQEPIVEDCGIFCELMKLGD